MQISLMLWYVALGSAYVLKSQEYTLGKPEFAEGRAWNNIESGTPQRKLC
jgi:hypothetical protein